MDLYSSTSITSKVYENGNLVDYKNYISDYDGEQMEAKYQDNNTIYYTKLNNDDLTKLMLIPNDNYNLDVRLLYDFPVTNTNNSNNTRKSKQKTLSKKRSKKNSSMKNKFTSINKTIY